MRSLVVYLLKQKTPTPLRVRTEIAPGMSTITKTVFATTTKTILANMQARVPACAEKVDAAWVTGRDLEICHVGKVVKAE